jgi:hypothetical protein
MHNKEMYDTFMDEDKDKKSDHVQLEGLGQEDEFNEKKFEREVEKEMIAIQHSNPERANRLKNFVLNKDTWVDEAIGPNAPEVPDEEIHFYPGSLKGPEPEDDPETYSRWFFEHQPKSLYSD